jgi:hypothetical protein
MAEEVLATAKAVVADAREDGDEDGQAAEKWMGSRSSEVPFFISDAVLALVAGDLPTEPLPFS